MNINYKYAIGIHVMFYEIEMFSDYIGGLLDLLSTVDNKENVYLDFVFNTSQFFEKIDTSKTTKDDLVDRFENELVRIKELSNLHYKIIDNDNEFYTQTNYRREFNTKYCEKVTPGAIVSLNTDPNIARRISGKRSVKTTDSR